MCPACGEVHYENPLNVVGTLPITGELSPLRSAYREARPEGTSR